MLCASYIAYPENMEKGTAESNMKGMDWNYIRYKNLSLENFFSFFLAQNCFYFMMKFMFGAF